MESKIEGTFIPTAGADAEWLADIKTGKSLTLSDLLGNIRFSSEWVVMAYQNPNDKGLKDFREGMDYPNLIKLEICIKSFPVSEEEIKKYWEEKKDAEKKGSD
jgi:hypothetical protein